MSSRSRSSSALAWLGSYPQVSRALAAIRVYTHVSGDVLDAALRGAYWAAQRAAIPGVVAEQRRAQERRLRVLARLEEAATDALSLEDPIPAELAGHVHVARALLRGYVRDIAAPAGARAGGRRRGWRSEAERELAAMGIRRREARALLAAVAVRAREGAIPWTKIPLVRAAFRVPAPARQALLVRFPIPAGQGPCQKAAK